ncbi:MAG: V-type ATP synthase subunit D [Lentisphaerae bacterium]|nr:V-type ATP synthase subunit D [Lentisphaerota bacterium]MCP4102168.1 V-type ATP synthase subunit D [Lentisphaerota bacterium]
MPKIKLTKTELKSQQDSLKQFTRFLPTLQLKKQQLQLEMRSSSARLKENEVEQEKTRLRLNAWLALFGDEQGTELLPELLSLKSIASDVSNIAGVNVPIFIKANFEVADYDLFKLDSWIDDAVEMLKELISLQEAHKILEEQHRLLARELRTTTQRVNLFEKVKIPECKENIRCIRIYLGDLDTAGVVRSKIAKRKSQEAQQL